MKKIKDNLNLIVVGIILLLLAAVYFKEKNNFLEDNKSNKIKPSPAGRPGPVWAPQPPARTRRLDPLATGVITLTGVAAALTVAHIQFTLPGGDVISTNTVNLSIERDVTL